MANQYAGSLPHIALEQFDKTAQELLREFEKDGISYVKAAEITGLQQNTIRKWCERYSVKLALTRQLKVNSVEKINLKSKTVNTTNFLYRKWQPKALNRDSCQ